MNAIQGYGLWLYAALNATLFIFFAWSFYKPVGGREWRVFGTYSAFIVALFLEMYGFPLSRYFLSGWLSTHFPEVDWLSHDAGHVLEMVFGWRNNPHFGPFHLASIVFIFGGYAVLANAWPLLSSAKREARLPTDGIYARLRHPQHVGFVLIMFGFLLQWPTLITLAMFPLLVILYVRLARREEHDCITRYGDAYRVYMARTPAFIPTLRRRRNGARSEEHKGHA